MLKSTLAKLVAIALFAIMIIPAQAQETDKKKYKAMFKELKELLHQYRTDNIQPKMSDWKQKLDNAMTKEDLDKLNELREKAKTMRIKMQAKMKEMHRKMKRECKENPKCDHKSKHGKHMRKKHGKHMKHENKKQMKALAGELRPLAEKYKSTLEEIGNEAMALHEKWENEMKQIVEDWKEAHSSDLEAIKDTKMGRKFSRMKMKMKELKKIGMHANKKRSAVKFMLWDGTMKAPVGPDDEQPINLMDVDEMDDSELDESLRNYPNPFSEKTTIYFSLPKKENVTLEVYDGLGKKLVTLHNGSLDAGDHHFDFNASLSEFKNLQAGTYIYKLSTDSFTKSGKMILTR
jgi:hypothetical protein